MQIRKSIIPVLGAAILLPMLALADSPYLTLSTYSGAPGSSVQVSGSGFSQNGTATVSLQGQSQTATAPINNGSFSGATLSVPQVATGNYTVTAQSSQGQQASSNFYVQGYYPTAQPNNWYTLPNQTLNFTGHGFAPNDTVTLSGPISSMTVTAGSSGNFTTGNITVPYGWQNSKQTFTLTGAHSAYPVSMTISVGSFYPNLNPSTYYIGTGQGMSAQASGFAPGETVTLSGGAQSVQTTADGSGNAGLSFTTPSSGGSFTITATGANSGISVSRTITLHQ